MFTPETYQPPEDEYLYKKTEFINPEKEIDRRLRKDGRLSFYRDEVENYIGLERVDVEKLYNEIIDENTNQFLTKELNLSFSQNDTEREAKMARFERSLSGTQLETQRIENKNGSSKLALGKDGEFNLLDYYALHRHLGVDDDKSMLKENYEGRLDAASSNLFAIRRDIDKKLDKLPLLDSEKELYSQQNHFAWGAYMFGFQKILQIYSHDKEGGSGTAALKPKKLNTYNYTEAFASLQREAAYFRQEYGQSGYKENFEPILKRIFENFDKKVIGQNGQYLTQHIQGIDRGAESELKGFRYLQEKYGQRVLWTEVSDDVNGLDAYILPAEVSFPDKTVVSDLPPDIRRQIIGVNFKSSGRNHEDDKAEIIKRFGIQDMLYLDSSKI